MGQFDEAEKFYLWVISRYPESPKIEVSSYRIDLIKQKKIEIELLTLLRWSHEESLRNSEEYQRRIRTYEHTLNSYQRRIAELTQAQAARPATAPRPSVETPGSVSAEPPRIDTSPSQAETPPPASAASSEELVDRARQLENRLQAIIDASGGIR